MSDISLHNGCCFDVLPTIGSGTAAVACKESNRSFIGIERELQYYEIAQRRVNELGG